MTELHNRGPLVEQSTGEWVAFCDGCDWSSSAHPTQAMALHSHAAHAWVAEPVMYA